MPLNFNTFQNSMTSAENSESMSQSKLSVVSENKIINKEENIQIDYSKIIKQKYAKIFSIDDRLNDIDIDSDWGKSLFSWLLTF